MDLHWERSYPYYDLKIDELAHIFSYLQTSLIRDIRLIEIGCRNTNYSISTGKSTFLVRITSQDSAMLVNELKLNSELRKIIKLPRILEYHKLEGRYFILYEFIAGENFSNFLNHTKIKANHIIQIAETLAKIHSFKTSNQIEKLELPPFENWYNFFLSNEKTANLLGNKRISFIKNFINNNHDLLKDIKQYTSFIHSDFRPANMIINPQADIYIVDWEYCTLGHSLADIGQFFRYQECFSPQDRLIFEENYNYRAKTKLAHNWYLLARLRDLVNPLQLLGSVEKKLQQEKDLMQVIDEIIEDLSAINM